MFMHTYYFIIIFELLLGFVTLSLSLSLSLSDRLRMAPKHKSTPARNPLGFKFSSSDPVPLLHVRFHDGKAL